MSLGEFIRAMPKAELHIHLEGSIQPKTLLELARRNGVALPAEDVPALRALYRFSDFDHFIKVYLLIQSCLQSVEDWTLIVHDLGVEMDRQNIRYAEVTFTPPQIQPGLPFEQIIAGIEAGREEARRRWGAEMRWMPDIVRDLGPEVGLHVAELAISGREHGVVALGLGGPENLGPAELFAEPFARARAAGLRSYPHAGELAGPQSVWNALRLLHADRIGHGVRASEDPALVGYLREHQITLDVCPTSNVRLHVYPDYASHPLRQLYEAGVSVTINSDDPPLFNTDLLQEYELAASAFGLSAGDLSVLSLNAVRASFLPAGEKAHLEAEFVEELERLRRRLL